MARINRSVATVVWSAVDQYAAATAGATGKAPATSQRSCLRASPVVRRQARTRSTAAVMTHAPTR